MKLNPEAFAGVVPHSVRRVIVRELGNDDRNRSFALIQYVGHDLEIGSSQDYSRRGVGRGRPLEEEIHPQRAERYAQEDRGHELALEVRHELRPRRDCGIDYHGYSSKPKGHLSNIIHKNNKKSRSGIIF